MLMLAQATSSIGDWLSIIAIITLVGLKWNASPMEVSLIILCLAVPMALFGPITGTLADRFSRKALMITSDLVRASLILLLTIADTIWMVYICLFIIGVFSSFFIPAKNGKLKELVPEKDMKSAMAITSMIDSSTKILGPLLSGALVTAFGAQTVFIIDSSTFLFSALLIAFLPNAVHPVKIDSDQGEQINVSFKEELLVGFTFIRSNAFLLVGMFFLGFSLLILQLSDSQIIVLIRELTAVSPDLFGYIVTASGTGMLLAGFILAKRTEYNAFNSMLIGVCGIGVSFGMMAVLTHIDMANASIWGPLLGFAAGFTATFVFVPFQTAVQIETPVHMTGRVFGVINSVTTTATIIGPLLGGWLATILGVVPTFIITASLLLSVSFIGFLAKNKINRGKLNVSKSQQGTPETTSS
ncbi:Predicted arabinose efflux permease, MFS family [Mesobacillus persicus]|uniref:Predicted arabinose efflux permease, MFS family n=2 Tax=Mesobacillus persicus TaxID=930146 RepID=A0A1H8IZF2_9BACI|nr:Predicted arabinose efflux permease, MFS family [Mesobacillus persicus]